MSFIKYTRIHQNSQHQENDKKKLETRKEMEVVVRFKLNRKIQGSKEREIKLINHDEVNE